MVAGGIGRTCLRASHDVAIIRDPSTHTLMAANVVVSAVAIAIGVALWPHRIEQPESGQATTRQLDTRTPRSIRGLVPHLGNMCVFCRATARSSIASTLDDLYGQTFQPVLGLSSHRSNAVV